MKYLSTFSGIGGFELGIGPDHECIGYSEIDKYATQIYQKHFPNHKNYGDITTINEKELPDFDLLVGGFPCQAFSIAGKRGGFEDTRGTMFFELARILRAKQPRLFVFENVKGLLSHDGGKSFSTIIQTADELGYDLQWQVLNSKNHGVPQNRERVFIVGNLRGTSKPEVFPFGCDDELSTNAERGAESEAEHTFSTIATNTKRKESNYIQQLNQPKHSNTITARYYGGQANGTYVTESEQHAQEVRVKEATKQGYAVAHEGDSINLSVPNSKTRRGRIGKGVAQTIDTGMQQHTLQNSQIRRLTPIECERLQGFPDGWTKEGHIDIGEEKNGTIIERVEISDTQRYKTLGNAVTVNVIKDIMERLLGDNSQNYPN